MVELLAAEEAGSTSNPHCCCTAAAQVPNSPHLRWKRCVRLHPHFTFPTRPTPLLPPVPPHSP